MAKRQAKAKRKTSQKTRSKRKVSAARAGRSGRLKTVRALDAPTQNISASALRLKALRKEAGLSVRAMAKALDMGATTYQHYEDRYKKRYLPYELVKPASEILKKRGIPRESVDALSPKLSNISEDVVNITYAPLISWVQAGELAEVVDPYAVGDAESEIAIEYNRDSVLALRVRGSSLNRVAPDGAIVIIDYCAQDLVPEKFYVVKKMEKLL